jgi:acetyl esterase/lipase
MDQDRPVIPDELRALMAEVGPQWSPPGHVRLMVEKFSEVHKAGSPWKETITVKRDVVYGPHPRQAFDIYLPEDGKTGRAAVLFVHGGAFLDGHRNRTEEIYSNVLHYFARNGVVGINIGYRLGNHTAYPGATEDVAAVVAWAHAHADELGVDRSRIFLMGHSAGAAHAGSYAYDKRRHPAAGPGLAGLIVVSGRVRAENRPENPNGHKVVTYYGTSDPKMLDDLSPISHVGPDSVPTFVAWGEFENPLIDMHCAELVFRLAQAKLRSPPVVWLRGHNHTSMIGHINTAEDDLGRAMLDFITNPR